MAFIEAGIPFDSPCGGQGTCLQCKIQISGVSKNFTELEQEKLSVEQLDSGWRLACQVTVEEPGEVRLPEMGAFRAKASLSLLGEEIPLQPNVQRRYFELNEPTISDQQADWDRLAVNLETSQPSPVRAELSLLREIPERLREGHFRGEAVLLGDTVVALDPPSSARAMMGVALDIGTTTLACGLVDLDTGKVVAMDTELNPQIAFGADVISRIGYMQDNLEKRRKVQKVLSRGLNQLLLRVCRIAKVERERIFEATVVGNTTMLHSWLGLNATHIALSPYVGVLNRAKCVPAKELGLQIHPRGRIHILPAIASFVGADTVAVILATRLYQTHVPKLAIDIGTNGEVILATKDGILTTSTAAGPAFEGCRIRFGMRATEGAISSFQATPSVGYTVIGNSPARGICGSGLIDLVADLFRVGVLNREGRMLLPSEAGSSVATELAQRVKVRGKEREFVVCKDGETEITISQQDVRELQLAKGAIRAGVELLMEEANIEISDIQEVLLSGVFGNYINREKALILGLIPSFPLEKIHFVGNAAMGGALRALINMEERLLADEISSAAHHVELSGRVDFEETFLRCLRLGN
jgi:uncharacterized 2Fe-2S/4Fe-4S cluster protein (DUF4445 family)